MAITNLYSNKICVVRAEIEDNMPIETIREVVEHNKSTFFNAYKTIAAVYVRNTSKSHGQTALRFSTVAIFLKFLTCALINYVARAVF